MFVKNDGTWLIWLPFVFISGFVFATIYSIIKAFIFRRKQALLGIGQKTAAWDVIFIVLISAFVIAPQIVIAVIILQSYDSCKKQPVSKQNVRVQNSAEKKVTASSDVVSLSSNHN